MRIALRSTTASTPNPLLTSTQTTGPSFLSVLAGAVGVPIPGVSAKNSGRDPQSDAGAANSQQQDPDATQAASQPTPGDAAAASLANIADTNLTILPASPFHAVLSTSDPAARASAKTGAADPAKDQPAANAVPSATGAAGAATIPVPAIPALASLVVPPSAVVQSGAANGSAVSGVTAVAATQTVGVAGAQTAPLLQATSAGPSQPAGVASAVQPPTASQDPMPAGPPQFQTSAQDLPVSTQTSAPQDAAQSEAAQPSLVMQSVAPSPVPSISAPPISAPVSAPAIPAATQVPSTPVTSAAASNPSAQTPPPAPLVTTSTRAQAVGLPSSSAPGGTPASPASSTVSFTLGLAQKAVSISTPSAPIFPLQQPAAPTTPAAGSHAASVQQSTDGSQSASASNAAAGNTTTPATPATVAPRASDLRNLPLILDSAIPAQHAAAPAPAAPASRTAGSNGTAQPAAGNPVTSAQPGPNNAAPNAVVKPAAGAVILPTAQVLPGLSFMNFASNSTPEAGKGSDSKIGDATAPQDSGSAGASGATKDSSAQNAASANGPSAQNTQASANPQHPQSDPTQSGAVPVKTSEASAQSVPAPIAPVHSGTQATNTGSAPPPSHASDVARPAVPLPADGSEIAGASGVNTAKLIQTLSETQMHVGLRSPEFGDISIRTALSQQQMVAQITVDHSDLSQAIAQHASAAQAKLGSDLGVRAAIQVTHSGMNFSSGGGQAQQQPQRSFVRPVEAVGAVSLAEPERAAAPLAAAVQDTDRLDIQA